METGIDFCRLDLSHLGLRRKTQVPLCAKLNVATHRDLAPRAADPGRSTFRHRAHPVVGDVQTDFYQLVDPPTQRRRATPFKLSRGMFSDTPLMTIYVTDESTS